MFEGSLTRWSIGVILVAAATIWLIIAESTGNIYSNWNIVPFLTMLAAGALFVASENAESVGTHSAGCFIALLFMGLAVVGLTTFTGTLVLLLLLFVAGCFVVPVTAILTISIFVAAIAAGLYPNFGAPEVITTPVRSGDFSSSGKITNAVLFGFTIVMISVERRWGELPRLHGIRQSLRKLLRVSIIAAPIVLAVSFSFFAIRHYCSKNECAKFWITEE